MGDTHLQTRQLPQGPAGTPDERPPPSMRVPRDGHRRGPACSRPGTATGTATGGHRPGHSGAAPAWRPGPTPRPMRASLWPGRAVFLGRALGDPRQVRGRGGRVPRERLWRNPLGIAGMRTSARPAQANSGNFLGIPSSHTGPAGGSPSGVGAQGFPRGPARGQHRGQAVGEAPQKLPAIPATQRGSQEGRPPGGRAQPTRPPGCPAWRLPHGSAPPPGPRAPGRDGLDTPAGLSPGVCVRPPLVCAILGVGTSPPV